MQKRLIVNTRERAVSVDINRSQAFLAYLQTEVIAAQYGRLGDYYAYPGVWMRDGDITNTGPLAARVINGLELEPDVYPTSLLVRSGVVEIYRTGILAPDEGPTVVVTDPGVVAAGVLTFTPNTGGSPRCDVIEVQPADTLIESTSRDIYDPLTGLFTPAIVEKVREPRLTYRYRVGTPGTQPSYSADWLPIAIAIVQTTSTSFQDTDFYDVRPLASEMGGAGYPWDSSTPIAQNEKALERSVVGVDDYNSGGAQTGLGVTQVQGWAKTQLFGVPLGGMIQKNTPGADGILNPKNAAEWINGTIPTTPGTHVGLVLYAPGLLETTGSPQPYNRPFPRFVKYSRSASVAYAGASRRLPQGPRGLLLFTTSPSAQVVTPATITAPGIGGCLGSAWGQIVATTYVASNGLGLCPFTLSRGGMNLWDFEYPQNVDYYNAHNSVTPTGGLVVPFTSDGADTRTIFISASSIPTFYAGAKRIRLMVLAGLVDTSPGSPIPNPFSQNAHGVSVDVITSYGTNPMTAVTNLKIKQQTIHLSPKWGDNTNVQTLIASYAETMIIDIDCSPPMGYETWGGITWEIRLRLRSANSGVSWWCSDVPSLAQGITPVATQNTWAIITGVEF